MHLRVTLDIDISFEEASFIKETFMKEYGCREITLIPNKKDEEINTDIDITKFESVDQIVSKEIESIEGEFKLKSANVAKYIRNLEHLAQGIKEIESTQKHRRNSLEKKIARLKDYLRINFRKNKYR